MQVFHSVHTRTNNCFNKKKKKKKKKKKNDFDDMIFPWRSNLLNPHDINAT